MLAGDDRPVGSKQPLHVACVISTMQPGGAQRVMALVCDFLAARGHEVSLVTLESEGTPSFFPLSHAVRQVYLGRSSEASSGIGRVRRVSSWVRSIRHALQGLRPDIVISFIDLTNVMVLLATRGLRIPVIVSERIDPHHHNIGCVGTILRRLIYPRASRIVVQTERAARFFGGYQKSKLVVLANPVQPALLPAAPGVPTSSGRLRILGVGRLDPQKGFDRLVAAFRDLAPRFPNWDVSLFGQGPQMRSLQAEIAAAGLAERIAILPPTRDVPAELAATHIFAFPSRYEGFPNALAEAMAAGLPCVAFRNVSGVEDLIVHGESGLLADQGDSEVSATESFASSLSQLMQSAEMRQRLGDAAQKRVELFETHSMLRAWEQLIGEVIDERMRIRSS